MAKKTKPKKAPWNDDTKGFALIALGALGLLSLLSFRFQQMDVNWLGSAGYLSALSVTYVFGLAAYLIPFYFFWIGTKLCKGQKLPTSGMITSIFRFSSALPALS